MINSKAGWYFCADTWEFYGFRHIDAGPDSNGPYAWKGELHGPYATFSGAKAGALTYYRQKRRLVTLAVAAVTKARINEGEDDI